MKNANNTIEYLLMLALAATLALASESVSGQVSASIVGRVEDASGAGVPEAMVSVISTETGVLRQVSADSEGNYRVLSLSVGRYEVKAEKTGFKASLQSGIDLVVGQEAVVNLSLQVGQMEQQVTVTSEAPLVNVTTTPISGLVGEEQVKDLPLNGRSFDNLITLNAGAAAVTAQKGAGFGAQSGNLFSVSGRNFGENLFLLNGVEYTGPSQIHSVPGGVSGQLLGIDAVREFNVVSDTYGAEYGKRAGAQISIVTQSGTNQLHGTVFEFLRNSALDAKNYFDHPVNATTGEPERIPPFKRNQFGGALGGPIRRDKTFIFGNYEGFRQRLGVSDVALVPDANARIGLLPCNVINPTGAGCAGNSKNDTTPTKVPGLVPGILPYVDTFWPAPNGPVLGGGIAEDFANPPQRIREDFGTVRVDHSFSGKDQLGTSYMIDDGYNETPEPNPNFSVITALRSQVLSLQETHLFSPSVINTATIGFSRAALNYTTPPVVPVPSNLIFVTGQLPGRFSVGGGSGTQVLSFGGGGKGTFQAVARTPFTYQDAIQVSKGKHQISAGVWFQRLRSDEFGGGTNSGQATFTSIVTMLQGTVNPFQVNPMQTPMYWRQLEGAWYVQDTIQLRPNLTVRVGLRHDFTNGYNEADDRASNFLFDSNMVPLTTPRVASSVYTDNRSKWLFGPRVGLAWDPFGKGKSSIRAGFGTYYDLIDTLGFVMDTNPPFDGTVSFSNVQLLSLVPINPSTPVPPSCGPGVPTPCTTYAPRGIVPTAKTPTIEEWNLAVEQAITANTSLRVSYVGSHGFHEILGADYNAIRPQVCSNAAGCISGGVGSTKPTVANGTEYIPVASRPNSNLASGLFWNPVGTSSYNALSVELTHRYSFGLQFRASYTWSKALDIASSLSGGDSLNNPQAIMIPTEPKADWGPSVQNQTNKFVFSGGYELPMGRSKPWLSGATGGTEKLVGGWQVNWIFSALSGFPFSALVGSNRSGDGDSNNPDRPSINPSFQGPIIIGSPSGWFNPNAFTLPTAGTFGNAGRDTLIGPDLRELDLSLFKTTSITERLSSQFRVEAFNLLNHANFGIPSGAVFSGTSINAAAGVITTTGTNSRQMQFALKLIF